MRFSNPARLVATATLVSSVGLGTVIAVSSGPAVAAGGSSITCKKVTGNASSTITLSKCNGNTGGASLPISATFLASGGNITWINGKNTVIGVPALKILANNLKCKAPNTNEGFTAPVLADTTGIPLGTAKGAVCITGPTGAIKASKPLKIT